MKRYHNYIKKLNKKVKIFFLLTKHHFVLTHYQQYARGQLLEQMFAF